MYFLIYKITNRVNGKIYIGKHKTSRKKDKYWGSSRWLKNAIQLYGVENFSKEILFEFQSQKEMDAKEADLVTKEFCNRSDTYNLVTGGEGSWSHVNLGGFSVRTITKENSRAYSKRANEKKNFLWENDPEWAAAFSAAMSAALLGSPGNFLGKSHKPESIAKMRISQKGKQAGERNSQFGKPRSKETKLKIRDGVRRRLAEKAKAASRPS